LTLKIGRLIEKFNSKELRRLDKANGTKDLWTAINKLTSAKDSGNRGHNITADDLNSHFATTSTDLQYIPPPLKQTAAPQLQDFNEQLVFGVLDRMKPTAEGSDSIPACLVSSSPRPHLLCVASAALQHHPLLLLGAARVEKCDHRSDP